MTSLHGLGKEIFGMLATAAAEAGLTSGVIQNGDSGGVGTPEPAFFAGVTTPTTGTAAAAATSPTAPMSGAGDSKSPNFGKRYDGQYYETFINAVKNIHPMFSGLTGGSPVADAKQSFPSLYALYKSKNRTFAKGGIINSPVQALLGESGPEAVIPLQGYSTRIALQKLFSVDQNSSRGDAYGGGSNINITVNNPIAETAEESISRRMKALSTSGLFR